MKVAVFGSGYVGMTLSCLAEFGHEVTLIDMSEQKVKTINNGKSPIYEPGLENILQRGLKTGKIKATTDYTAIDDSDVVFISVGTPSKDDGSIDLSQIESASRQIGKGLIGIDNFVVVVVKSTVLPGTTKNVVKKILEEVSGKKCGTDFGLCMNPEFLKEGTAVEDFMKPDKIVIGCSDDRSYSIVEDLYSDSKGITPIIKTDLNTAEMIKYAQNAALAARVSFINEMANICEKFNVDVKEVAYAIGLDSRIGPKFLKAGAGFGGSCFPKDVKALRAAAKSVGIEPIILNAILDVNERQPHRLVDMLKETLGDLSDKNIAVLGLAFKPDTDDMREAPSIKIINSLLSEGSRATVYDPQAMGNAKNIFADSIEYAASADECVKNADACLIVTEWDEFKKLDPSQMKCSVIIDGRRVIEPQNVKETGTIYKGIGWKGN
jgi:UDPglucose 6-dehydrogenase